MNKHKLSDDEVPKKFSDWLLEMGCPAEDIPSCENMTRLCRGHYYMVWRSLMEHVESKDVIRQKRLQVFLDDMKRAKDAKNYNSNVIEPDELKAWREAQELSRKVKEAGARVAKAQEQLKQATDKVSSKLSDRNSLLTKVNNANRRVWFLQKANEELALRKQNLVETKHIADSLCHGGDNRDVKVKLEKCMSLLLKQCFSPPSQLNSTSAYPDPVACSSLVSNVDDDTEDNMSALVKSPANVLWSLLHDKRKCLITSLIDEGSRNKSDWNEKRTSARTVLSNTTALHCLLSLETIKLRLQLKNVRRNLADTVSGLSELLAGPACELLVLKCERACAESRVNTLKKILEDITGNGGVFSPKEQEYMLETPIGIKHIAEINKAILRKKDDLRSVLLSLMKTERRIMKVKDSLVTLFEGFQKELLGSEVKRGIKLDLDTNSVQTVRRFYSQYREKKSRNIDLSMEFDVSFTDDDIKDPRFVDELKFYLKRFSLDNNRKLVLKSGEKIWIFESINASMERFHSNLQTDDVTPSALLCQSISPEDHMVRFIEVKQTLASIVEFVKVLEQGDVKLKRDFETLLNQRNDTKLDRMKKQLKLNITHLERTQNTLNAEKEILKLWSDNVWRKYISSKRLVNGQTYEEIERVYLNSQNPF